MKTHPLLFSVPFAAALFPFAISAQQVTGWGLNVQGQTTVPAAVVEPVRVASGTYHSAALLRDGSVVAWGTDTNGSLAVPAGLSGVIQIECAYYTSYALKSDGSVVSWGDNWWTQRDLPPWLGSVVMLAGGGNHALALNTDGMVVAWGSNAEGQLDAPPAVQRRTLQIAAGGYHSLAIGESGSVTAWGGNTHGQATVPAGLGACRAVAGGLYHTLALRADGTVAAWGLNTSGQCSVPAGLTNVVAISAGYWHSTALRADGTVVTWGHNGHGQSSAPSGLGNAAAVESSGSHSLALISDSGRAPDIISPARALSTTAATQFHYRAAALHGPVTWSLAGALPAGLVFDAATGILSGSTTAGTHQILIQAANGAGTDSHTLQLTVINNALPSLADAVDAPQLLVWSDQWWRATATAEAHDGVDHAWCETLPCTDAMQRYGTWSCTSSAYLGTRVRGPVRLSCWLSAPSSFSTDVSLSATATGLAGAMAPAGATGPGVLKTMDLGPGLHTVTWTAGMVAYSDSFLPPTISVGASVNELAFTPLSGVLVAEALDLAGGWTTSAPDSWTGLAADHAHDGVDYACMAHPAVAFSTAWIERAFTGPARVQWRWRTEAGAGTLKVLQNGAVALTAGTGSQTAWQSAYLDLPAGEHTLRWEGQSSHTGVPVVAALDAVVVLPSVTIAGVLGSTGLTWTTGGAAPWTAVTDSGVAGHPTLAAVAPAAGQDGWLETTVTGPGMLSFWAGAPPGNPTLTVIAAGVVFPVSFSYQAQAQQRLSLPAGSHAVRFSATSALHLDDFTWEATADTAAARIELASSPLMEQRLGSSALGALSAGTTYTCADYRTLTFAPPALTEPWTLRFRASGAWTAGPALTDGYVSSATLSDWFVPVSPGGGLTTFATRTSAACVLDSVSAVVAAPMALSTAWTTLPVTVSDAARVRGLSAFGKTADSRSVWLDASSTDSAWLEMTVQGPLLLTFDKLGQGQFRINGGAPVLFSYSNNWGEQQVVVPGGAPATVRLETVTSANPADLVVENLRTTAPVSVTLAEALETTSLTPGGAGTWTGYDFAPWADGMGDFAQSPDLSAGQEAWLAGTLTGPFEIAYRLAEPGSRLRVEIDGIVQADTQVAAGNGTFRVAVAPGRARSCRLIVSGGAVRIGGIADPPGSLLGTLAASTLLEREAVLWAANLRPGMFPQPGSYSLPGEFGVFVRGPARVRFNLSVIYWVPQIWLPPTATGHASATIAGTTYEGDGRDVAAVVPAGLHAASFLLQSGGGTYPSPPWPAEYGSYYSTADAMLSTVTLDHGNADYRNWAAAQNLAGFDAQPGSDKDGDGLTNDLEFLLGTSPSTLSAAPLTPSYTAAGRLRVSVPVPSHATAGSDLILQTSPDLLQWTTAGSEAMVETAGGFQFYEAPAGARFARFGATVTP